MQTQETQPNKSSCTDSKPATVVLSDDQIIEAAHHVVNDDAQLLHLYLEERDGGIDITIPLTCAGTMWARSPAGERALGLSSDGSGSEQDVTVTGSRRNVPTCTCGADLFETAELTTTTAPKPDRPSVDTYEVPDATCSECGESVGAAFGTMVAVTIWEMRGEPLPGSTEDNQECKIVTDGGRPAHSECGNVFETAVQSALALLSVGEVKTVDEITKDSVLVSNTWLFVISTCSNQGGDNHDGE